MASEVLVPSSPAEAVELFGDGAATTVVGGGTIIVADISYGRLDPGRVLLLSHAGLDGVSVDGDTVTIGATTPIDALLALEEHAAALGACARNLADYEIRGQGTVGGNLCVGAGHDVPRGDLQGCLLALDARVRSAGADGERTEPLEDFLANRQDRLVLDVSFDRPAASAFVALEYPHTHEYTVIAVTGARSADGTTRLAATGVAGPGARLRSAEALASDPAAAGAAAVGDVTFADDALASAWYREQTLPVLVRRVLTQLEESS
jgi:aerobic carbon-monoxide dehydrogenase medium subunit